MLMSDGLFCDVTEYGAQERLARYLVASREPCHVFGVAFDPAGEPPYKIGPLIIPSEASFWRRWEAHRSEIREELRDFPRRYHELLERTDLCSPERFLDAMAEGEGRLK